jgi:hypothetical protein
MTRVPAKIVPLLDVSDSMQFYKYLTPAKVALDTFVNMFQLGDMFCVLSFSDSVYNVYPSTTTLATYSSPSVLQAASTAIQAVKSVMMTNIGDAIIAAKNVLQPQAEPRGIVLLSDGEWNRGPDPMKVLPTGIPIYTIALGDNGQLGLMRDIAGKTGGQYFFSPDAIALASIYFDILERAKVGQVASNALREVTAQRPLTQVVQVQPNLPSASIGFNWGDPSLPYGGNNPPVKPNGVYTKILTPDFKPWTGPVTYDQFGYAVAQVASPMPGTWTVTTYYNGSGSAKVTAAGLLATNNTSLSLSAPADVQAGTPIRIRAQVMHEGAPLRQAHDVSAVADVPSISMEEALQQTSNVLSAVELPEEIASDHPAADRMRLNRFRASQLPYIDVLPRHVVAAKAVSNDDSVDIQVETSRPGEYNIRVELSGAHPDGGEFARTRMITVSVR